MCTSLRKYNGRLCPCGKCPECLRAKQNSIMQVLYDTGLRLGAPQFITLTYDNEHMPLWVRATSIDDETFMQNRRDIDEEIRAIDEQQTKVKRKSMSSRDYNSLMNSYKEYREDLFKKRYNELREYQKSINEGFRPSRERESRLKRLYFKNGYKKCTTQKIKENGFEYYVTPSLDREDVKKWLKRCRKNYSETYGEELPDFKYYILGEYGPQTSRPHYHALFYGLTPKQMDFFGRDWYKHNGIYYLEQVKGSSSDLQNCTSYVAKYINKGTFEPDCVKFHLAQKPRCQVSSGMIELSARELDWYTGKDIGLTSHDSYYSDEDLQRVYNRLYRTVNGFNYKLSDKYKQKYFKDEIKEIDYWTGEVKVRRINTPLQDALSAFVQRINVAMYYAELEECEFQIQMGESRFNAVRHFEDSRTGALEERKKASFRKLQQAVAKSRF